MFGDLIGGIAKIAGVEAESEEKDTPPPTAGETFTDAGRAISAVDERAAAGEITYNDFILMSKTFDELDGKMSLPGTLDAKAIAETKAKFAKHAKIVECMTDEEKENPQLMSDDLNDVENKLPRVQRLAKEAKVSEKDVALFVAEFEMMRQSTARIAAGEDPDAVNKSLEEGSGNRKARREIKKAQKKGDKRAAGPKGPSGKGI